MANETWKFVQAKRKQAMKQVLGIRDEKARMTVTPPLAMAPVTQEDDMRWNPNYCYGYCHYYGSRCRQASPRECSCNPMHVSPIVRAVLVRARACEPVSKRSL